MATLETPVAPDQQMYIELGIYGAIAVVLEAATYVSAVGVQGVEQNEAENAVMIYNVKTLWYGIDAMATIAASLGKMIVGGLGFVVFVEAFTENTDPASETYWLNIVCVCLLSAAEVLWAYRLASGGLYVSAFFPKDLEYTEKIQFKG